MDVSNYFTAPIAQQIWEQKYQLKNADGSPIDITVQDTWRRVAKALASVEAPDTKEKYENEFYQALHDFKFLPAGRIVAGAGSGRSVTLFNCFVMGTVPDSMEGIFQMLKEAALTMQQGGGIGYDFSTLRPKGTLVKGVAADASGPLSFMDCWDAMCRTVMSAGSRRGAMMATMRCDHPDIFDFVHAKKDSAKLRMFNLSVLATDDFMFAVKNDLPWHLMFNGIVHDTIQARELWDAIMTSTYNQAEPGVIFIDRINNMNNLQYCETIASTNPCGEQPLPPYGACLLGSLNLTKFITHPFTNQAQIDWYGLNQTIHSAVRMMDNVIDVSNFPLPEQEAEAKAKRRIGLGVTGLADALIMLGLVYGSDEAVSLTEFIMRNINTNAYLASVSIAREKGSFPLFNTEKFLNSGFMVNMSTMVREQIREHGIRNALLTSIAPTGTISLYAGNVSSGIEPVFAGSYTRKVLNPDGTKREEIVEDYALAAWEKHNFYTDLGMPPAWVTAQDLPPEAHLKMQAAAQRWVDSSISKTINLPKEISYEDFAQVYLDAFDMSCKGCTTYRPNDITGSVLSVEPTKEEAQSNPEPFLALVESSGHQATEPVAQPRDQSQRPEDLQGMTRKIKFGSEDHAMYVTLTYLETDGQKHPYEIFINSKNMDHYIWTVALTRMISAVFRSSGDSRFVVEELKSVFDPKGGGFYKGAYRPSILAAIGMVIEEFMQSIGYIQPSEQVHVGTDEEINELFDEIINGNLIIGPGGMAPLDLCPKCFGSDFKNEGGCETCMSCGHSKCG